MEPDRSIDEILNDCNVIWKHSKFLNKQTNLGKSKSTTSNAWEAQCANVVSFRFLTRMSGSQHHWLILPQHLSVVPSVTVSRIESIQ